LESIFAADKEDMDFKLCVLRVIVFNMQVDGVITREESDECSFPIINSCERFVKYNKEFPEVISIEENYF